MMSTFFTSYSLLFAVDVIYMGLIWNKVEAVSWLVGNPDREVLSLWPKLSKVHTVNISLIKYDGNGILFLEDFNNMLS